MNEGNSFEKKENTPVTTETLTTNDLIEIVYKGEHTPQDNRFLSEKDGGVFRHSALEDISFHENEFFFPIIKVGEKIVGLSKLQKDPFKDKSLWIQFLSIDPQFQGNGYASKLADEIFRFAKREGYSLETSSYTEIGYEKLKSLFNRLAQKYLVSFIDKEKL